MKRYSGVLMAITSLPSKYGIGCFSKSAYDFVDWLEKAGQKYWQILPLSASGHDSADSPYQAFSAFAGNPYFISLEDLIEEGVLTEKECDEVAFGEDPSHVDYQLMHENRLKLLHKAYERSAVSADADFLGFVRENSWWLDDYALFMAVKAFFGGKHWTDWPEDIRMHWGPSLDYYRRELYFDVEFQKYLQFKFHQQWSALKAYANKKHIQIVGDIPIYVSPDSADVWAHPEMFQLNERNLPTRIAGCPPDDFAEDGQLWGNPLYRWEHHKQTGYHWWVTRMWHSFQLYDVVRIDHFRGFDQYFSIAADARTAKDGYWEPGPGMDLFDTIRQELGEKRVIAEDLGLMTDSVRKLVKDSGFPNMKVLQFAFNEHDDGGRNEYLPHNYGRNCWVYTGTHDNETTAGWLAGMEKPRREYIRDYLDDHSTANKWLYKKLVKLAMASCARVCVVPIQDWLGLDNTARMNQPGTVGVNWGWRLLPGATTDALAEEILAVTKRYNRANWEALSAKKEAQEKAPAREEEISQESLT